MQFSIPASQAVPPSEPLIRPTWPPSTSTSPSRPSASCSPADILFKWGVKGDDKIDGRFYLYAIKVSTPDGKAPLDGSVVTEATEQYAQRGATAEVSMTMNAEGTQEWSRMTGENIGKCIAIVLDGYVYSAPRVNSKIDKGQSQITGDFTIQEAKDLANVLNSGKVPAPAKIIQDTVVGPSLGQESINAGMISFVIAFILVLLYMGLFYKTAGWMSDVALLTNVFLLMGVLVSFGAVLTLPGIAGIVLTMGMAVDANVIIYERIKEELRGGKGLSLAIKDGFSKAYSAIIDGNLTTIITGIVLFIFGNGPVQGFATTLIIGIITSFFCAIFITRLLIEWIVGKWGNISFSRRWSENFLNNTRVDFIAKRKLAYGIAVSLMVLSCVSFFARGLNLGAEFTGGRAYVIPLRQGRFGRRGSSECGEGFLAVRRCRRFVDQFRGEAVRQGEPDAHRDAVSLRRYVGRGYFGGRADHLRRSETALFV